MHVAVCPGGGGDDEDGEGGGGGGGGGPQLEEESDFAPSEEVSCSQHMHGRAWVSILLCRPTRVASIPCVSLCVVFAHVLMCVCSNLILMSTRHRRRKDLAMERMKRTPSSQMQARKRRKVTHNKQAVARQHDVRWNKRCRHVLCMYVVLHHVCSCLGESWEELEEKAKRSDRNKGDGDEDDDDEPRRPAKKAKAAGPPTKKR